MAWIELHQARQRHPKTLRLAAALDVSRREACGLLDDLWTWALDIADRDGLIPGLGCEDIAVALDYPRKRGAWLMDALVRAGYVDLDDDGAYRLHDWYEYAGKLNDKRADTKSRVAHHRERKKSQDVTQCNALRNAYSNAKNDTCNASTVPNRTLPYQDTITTTTVTARESDNSAPEEDALTAYVTNNLHRLTPGNWESLREVATEGMTEDMIRLAVDTANAQGVRTFAYVQSVLDRWIVDGLRTPDDVREAEKKRKEAGGNGRRNAGDRARPANQGNPDKPRFVIPGEIRL